MVLEVEELDPPAPPAGRAPDEPEPDEPDEPGEEGEPGVRDDADELGEDDVRTVGSDADSRVVGAASVEGFGPDDPDEDDAPGVGGGGNDPPREPLDSVLPRPLRVRSSSAEPALADVERAELPEPLEVDPPDPGPEVDPAEAETAEAELAEPPGVVALVGLAGLRRTWSDESTAAEAPLFAVVEEPSVSGVSVTGRADPRMGSVTGGAEPGMGWVAAPAAPDFACVSVIDQSCSVCGGWGQSIRSV